MHTLQGKSVVIATSVTVLVAAIILISFLTVVDKGRDQRKW